MTQRSRERWNAGKRGASQRKAWVRGKQWASRHADLPLDLAMEIVLLYEETRKFRVRNLADAYRLGIREWFYNEPVDF